MAEIERQPRMALIWAVVLVVACAGDTVGVILLASHRHVALIVLLCATIVLALSAVGLAVSIRSGSTRHV